MIELISGGSMKPLLCTLAAALLILQVGCVTDPYRGHPHGLSADELTRELDLTAPQSKQVEQILDSERAEREQLHESGAQMSPDNRREQMQALHRELLEKLSAVLSPAQLQKFEQLERQRRHRGGRFESYGQGPPEQ
jgi:hypothetical protein